MAKEAERLLDGSGWLPEPLRLADIAGEQVEETPADTGNDTALPDFLADDDEEDPVDEGNELTSIAAE